VNGVSAQRDYDAISTEERDELRRLVVPLYPSNITSEQAINRWLAEAEQMCGDILRWLAGQPTPRKP
jgi:hypothetical protein